MRSRRSRSSQPNQPAHTNNGKKKKKKTPVTMFRTLSQRSMRAVRHVGRVPSATGSTSERFSASFFTLRSSSEKVQITFVNPKGESTVVQASLGQSLRDVAYDNDIELEGACGGEMACSTCHLVFERDVFDSLPEITEGEEDILDQAWGLTDTSRLGCQVMVTKHLDGATVRVPDGTNNLL